MFSVVRYYLKEFAEENGVPAELGTALAGGRRVVAWLRTGWEAGTLSQAGVVSSDFSAPGSLGFDFE